MLIVYDKIMQDSISQYMIDFVNFCVKNNTNVIIIANYIDNNIIRFIDKKVIVLENKVKVFKNFYTKRKIQTICKTNNINICMFYYANNDINFGGFFKKNRIILFTILNNNAEYIGDFFVKNSDKIIVFNEETTEFLFDNNVVDVKKIIKVKYDIDSNYYSAKNVSNGRCGEVLKQIGIDNCNKKIIQFFCNYNNIEKCMIVVAVANYLKNNMLLDDFVIVMSGYFHKTRENRAKITKYVQKLKLQEYVKITDCIYDKPALYYCSYVVIYLNKKNTNILKEAMFMERPVISSIHCIKNDIVEYKNGFFVDEKSVLDMASKIHYILTMPKEKYDKMCVFSKEYKKRHFENKSSLQDILDIINKTMYDNGNDLNTTKISDKSFFK